MAQVETSASTFAEDWAFVLDNTTRYKVCTRPPATPHSCGRNSLLSALLSALCSLLSALCSALLSDLLSALCSALSLLSLLSPRSTHRGGAPTAIPLLCRLLSLSLPLLCDRPQTDIQPDQRPQSMLGGEASDQSDMKKRVGINARWPPSPLHQLF